MEALAKALILGDTEEKKAASRTLFILFPTPDLVNPSDGSSLLRHLLILYRLYYTRVDSKLLQLLLHLLPSSFSLLDEILWSELITLALRSERELAIWIWTAQHQRRLNIPKSIQGIIQDIHHRFTWESSATKHIHDCYCNDCLQKRSTLSFVQGMSTSLGSVCLSASYNGADRQTLQYEFESGQRHRIFILNQLLGSISSVLTDWPVDLVQYHLLPFLF